MCTNSNIQSKQRYISQQIWNIWNPSQSVIFTVSLDLRDICCPELWAVWRSNLPVAPQSRSVPRREDSSQGSPRPAQQHGNRVSHKLQTILISKQDHQVNRCDIWATTRPNTATPITYISYIVILDVKLNCIMFVTKLELTRIFLNNLLQVADTFDTSRLAWLYSGCRGHVYTEGVELIPVTAFRLEPLLQPGQHPGHLTVDGEQVRTETIQVGGRERLIMK